MRTIYKYLLSDVVNEIELPENAQVLSAGVQNNETFIWAEVYSNSPKETRKFVVIGTGWDINEFVSENSTFDLKFIQTIFVYKYVFHVFELV